MYSQEIVKKYVEIKDDFGENDPDLFKSLAIIGIAGKDILDFGCGDGGHTENLLKMGAKKVIGIDSSEAMIEFAQKRKMNGLEFILADGTMLPFNDCSFDIVFSNFVIHHFIDAHLPFAEISRVLRKNGYFVGTYNITDVKKGFEHLYNTTMPVRLGKKENAVIVQNLIKPRVEIESALKKAGLKVLMEKILDHPSAVVDESYENRANINKIAVLVLAQKD